MIKIAPHHEGQSTHPDILTKNVSDKEIADMRAIVNKYFEMNPVFHYSDVCMYTNTPDEHFIIDYHSQFHNIIIASPCSGHGFKFSSLTGKILANMALEKEVPFDIKPFSISRLYKERV